MIFTSLEFLVFLSLLLASFSVVRRHEPRLVVLLLASYVFYAWWNVSYVLIILASSLWGYGLARLASRSPSRATRKACMVASVTLSLLTLAFYKYADFLLLDVLRPLGLWQGPGLEILLPVGISFFLFQNMSYTIDAWRGKIKTCESLTRYLLFVSFFPQLVAGPIVRASQFLPQLERRLVLTPANFARGAQLFIGGAVQKVVVADHLSIFADAVFAAPASYSTGTLWLGLAAYSCQIFCDFSGYSLMAIGVARVFGFELPENFRMPYLSRNVSEFWRRWHISLSSWLRDYLYISLGGNRRGRARTVINLQLTMLLGGLWHGASWNFVLWGAIHGIGLSVHKTASSRLGRLRLPRLLAWAVTLLFVCLAWVPFRSPGWPETLTYFTRLFRPEQAIHWYHTPTLWLLAGTAVWHLLYRWRRSLLDELIEAPWHSWRSIATNAAGVFAIVLFAPIHSSPFIYFQF